MKTNTRGEKKMADNAINPINNSSTTTNNQSETKNNSSIDTEGFLNLFVQSLKNQDPMEPMSNGEMMEQFSQLTQMQNTMNMKTILEDLASSIQGQNPIGNYLDLIGKKVKIQDDENSFQEGKVLSVGTEGSNVVFELENGKSYSVNQIVGATNY